MHVFLHFTLSFCIKSYRKGILVISYRGTHFSPYNLSLGLFNLSAWIVNQFLSKNHLSIASNLVWVSLSHFSPQGHFGLFTSNNFWAERYFKIPHFGSLSILVRFVVFNCFTLRYFQISSFLPVLYFMLFANESFFV